MWIWVLNLKTEQLQIVEMPVLAGLLIGYLPWQVEEHGYKPMHVLVFLYSIDLKYWLTNYVSYWSMEYMSLYVFMKLTTPSTNVAFMLLLNCGDSILYLFRVCKQTANYSAI
jgi:hypothetical protein